MSVQDILEKEYTEKERATTIAVFQLDQVIRDRITGTPGWISPRFVSVSFGEKGYRLQYLAQRTLACGFTATWLITFVPNAKTLSVLETWVKDDDRWYSIWKWATTFEKQRTYRKHRTCRHSWQTLWNATSKTHD